MKKVLSLILISLLGTLATAGFLLYDRYRQNPEQIVPYPYLFKAEAPAIKVEAPILIIGDRMGAYLAKFKEEMAATISQNLSNSIKVQSIARPGIGLHRTLHELKGLGQWPQILIYQGGSEEFLESKFNLSEIAKIKTNFSRYSDDRIETFLILYPWLSRVIYEPHQRVILPEQPENLTVPSEEDYLKRLETELLLYEQQLRQLVNLARDRNSLLILTTTPINLDIPPKKVCEFTTTIDIEKEKLEVKELLDQNNLKAAFSRSGKLTKQYVGNAELFYLHGTVARRLGMVDEAINSFLEASAYDCSPWRMSEVQNSIIRKVAKEQQVILFDFSRMLQKDFTQNPTFFDEIYPQNLYYERGMQQLGMAIKSILKL